MHGPDWRGTWSKHQWRKADGKSSLPFKIGYDLAGTVAAAGDEVAKVKVGDEVFCCLPFKDRGLLLAPFLSPRQCINMKTERYGTGSVSEYALTTETFVISKPKNLNFVDAASIPMVALTAIQMFDKVPGGVHGKTVFVPAGRKCFLLLVVWNEQLTLCCGEVSGVGSVAVQMAKNVYGAERVITTVSTAKVSMVDGLLGKDVVDESELSRNPEQRNGS